MKKEIIVYYCMLLAVTGCQHRENHSENTVEENTISQEGTFGYDLAFLKKYKKVTVLTAPDDTLSQAAIVADYQGRVMTSTASGKTGNSYGWINYGLIKSGESKPHMNAFGGEDRIWLSPEGGQFSVYFEKGKDFNYENWQTPAVIDSDPYEVVSTGSASVKFRKEASLENNSGARFDFVIEREVKMLTRAETQNLLKTEIPAALKFTGYVSENKLVNTGEDWLQNSGALGIWILGMFNPTPQTTIVAPFSKTESEKLLLTADYFGVIPSERLVVGDKAVMLKADGKYRSKIGLAPQSAKNVAGSYDAEKGILTIVYYDLDKAGSYLKSTWEKHEDPFGGDVLNAYNDGPLDDGSQMGPFYELESSSKVKFLKTNENVVHRHHTFHFEGDKALLNALSVQILNITIAEIENAFKS